jgi:hypothetical protein
MFAVDPNTPYKGNAESWHARKVGPAWNNGGGAYAFTTLCGEIDGAEWLVMNSGFYGQNFKKQVKVAMGGLYRTGMTHAEIKEKVDQIIAKSPKERRKDLTNAASEYLPKIVAKEEEARKMEDAIFKALGKNTIEGVDATPKRLFARIVSRANHCYREEGGALSVGQIAERLGFKRSTSPKSPGKQAVLGFFGDCERAGLLVISGQEEPRRYQLIQPS